MQRPNQRPHERPVIPEKKQMRELLISLMRQRCPYRVHAYTPTTRHFLVASQHPSQVFLLAPSLKSWEQMQLDSPTPTSLDRHLPSGGRSSHTTLRSPPPQSGAPKTQGQIPSQSRSEAQRGFPPEPPRAVTDDRGFPVLLGDVSNENSRNPWSATPSPGLQRRVNSGGGGDTNRRAPSYNNGDQVSPSPELLPRQRSNLFLSPFSSTLPPEKATLAATTRFNGNRTSWMGRAMGGGVSGAEPPSPPSPARQAKGSHMKLDLLLYEMQRLNGRLDTIVSRLGALEEERMEVDGSHREKT